MRYLALGDSISIDDYTGIVAGGAASQFARLIGAQPFENLTYDGCTTDGVLEVMRRVMLRPDVVTLTAGGNDFLQAAFGGADPRHAAGRHALLGQPLNNVREIAQLLAEFRCPVILNTIYDPTDGRDDFDTELGIGKEYRAAFNALNDGIRQVAREHGFLLSDLQALFTGHGIPSRDTWIVGQIEPNYAGATAIAQHWHRLYRGAESNADPVH